MLESFIGYLLVSARLVLSVRQGLARERSYKDRRASAGVSKKVSRNELKELGASSSGALGRRQGCVQVTAVISLTGGAPLPAVKQVALFR